MRRSRRKLCNPVQDAIEYCRRGRDKEGFIKRHVGFIKRHVDNTTGYGLFTTEKFSKGEFLLQYVGENISSEEGQKREDKYPESPDYDDDHEVDGDSPPSLMARKRQITQGPDYDDDHEVDGDSPPWLMARKCQITQGPEYDDDHEVDGDSPPWLMARKRQITQGPEYDDDHEVDGDSPPWLMARKRQITQGPDYDDDHEVDGDSPPSLMARKRQITQGPDYDDDHEVDGDSPPSLMARKRQITQDKTRLSENKKQGRKYIKWNEEQEAIVLSYFQGFIMNKESKKLPGRKDIQRFLKKTPQLGKRYDWKTIRTKIMNEKVKRERHLQQRLSSMQVL